MTHAKLMKMNGEQVKCIIEKEEVLGIISIEDGFVFVCQDTFKGKPCTDKKGKKYSWLVSSEEGPYEDCDRRCSDIVPVKSKWEKREQELREIGEIEYIGKKKVLRKVGEEYQLFDRPNIKTRNVPDLVKERLKGSRYEAKNLLFLKNLHNSMIFYIDTKDRHFDCLAIILDGAIPVAIPLPVLSELYNCSYEDIDELYNQKIEKDVWVKDHHKFYTARI